MHLSQLQQFFAMGGYAKYVWSAYGVTFLVLLIIMIRTTLNHRQILIQLKQTHATIHHVSPKQRWQTSEISMSKDSSISSSSLQIE